MTLEMGVVLVLLAIAVVLFVTERLPVDLVALLVMSALLILNIISPEEGIAGFSNKATVTVGAMFILSAGLYKTGAVNFLGHVLGELAKRNFWWGLLAIMVTVGVISAFINNTAAVAIMLPIILGVAANTGVNPSKLLMPLSFASMFGGVCTLIGTSTNILVSSIAERHGLEPFGMFEFLPFGLIIFGVGIAYMFLVGVRLIPNRRLKGDLTQNFQMSEYLTDIVLLPNARSVGKRIFEAPLVKELDLGILGIYRKRHFIAMPSPDTVLLAGDVLRVRCRVKDIKKIQESTGIELKSDLKIRGADLVSEKTVLVEAVVAPNSELEGATLKKIEFRNRFGAMVLALRHRGELLRKKFAKIPLRSGDALLLEVKRDHLPSLEQNSAFVIVSELGVPQFRKSKMIPAASIVTAVVFVAAMNWVPIVVSAIIGSVLLVLTRCITMEEAYKSIEWRVIFLLAGVLTLGTALEKTGGAALLSSAMMSAVGAYGPKAIISVLFFLTFMLTNFMSNNATAALLAPISIAAAHALGLDPRPFLMAITFAASLSFMTPVGYQTNTMIYSAGQYKFADFLKVGTPLNLLFWLLGSIFIPVFWPLGD